MWPLRLSPQGTSEMGLALSAEDIKLAGTVVRQAGLDSVASLIEGLLQAEKAIAQDVTLDINQALDRFRDEVTTPVLTAVEKLQQEAEQIRLLLSRIDGAVVTSVNTVKLGTPNC